MVENPELTLRILQYFARDNSVDPPANMTVENLAAALGDMALHEHLSLLEHVWFAYDDDLIYATVELDGLDRRIDRIQGLTLKGENYVNNAEAKKRKFYRRIGF